MLVTIIGLPAAALLVLLALLLAWSPGRPLPFLQENGQSLAGSISEKSFLGINGTRQGMFIKSRDSRNPVLLFVHGGPGMPEYWLTSRYPTGLEDHFTVVWWEQRGAGLSFDSGLATDTMNAEQFIADTLEVTRRLQARFGQEKIYLMGHSWGSYIAIQAAAQAPELYRAYIGMGQITRQIRSERIAWEFALAKYREEGNLRMVRKLEAAPPSETPPLSAKYMALRDRYMHDLGIGTTRDMKSVVTGIFLQSWRFREYTLEEKIQLWQGKIYSGSSRAGLWDALLAKDLTGTVPALEIPAYFLHGIYDYTCDYSLARDYFDSLKAPVKGFYTFGQSAHTPLFEEPENAVNIFLNDILKLKTGLADAGRQGGA